MIKGTRKKKETEKKEEYEKERRERKLKIECPPDIENVTLAL